MSRLSERFDGLRSKGGKAFVAYLMAGDPSIEATREIVRELDRAGVTAVELGVPFSDPIADGPVIQAAGNRALGRGVTLAGIFRTVSELRRETALPILLMGYWNVFRQAGEEAVVRSAVEAGVDGFIIPDLPAEAGASFYGKAREAGLATVLLATELTADDRLRRIVETASGFLYYVPKLGITGLDLQVTAAIRERIAQIKRLSSLPVCVGIGIKTREDVKRLTEVADGVIVGTRIVDFIDKHKDDPDLAKAVAGMVAGLLSAPNASAAPAAPATPAPGATPGRA